VQGIQSVAWNSYLGQWVMVHHNWGDGTHIYCRTSTDGINWSAASTLITETAGIFLNYAQIIGDTGESCGQDALLVYERSPSLQPGRSRDMIERWIHWGPLTVPAQPAGLSAKVQGSRQARVLLQWNATTQTEAYNVFRSTTSGGTGTNIGSVRTSASFPTFTDAAVTAGTIYYYQVQATNAAGASAFSSAVSVTQSGLP
jgi:hypothetical protein